MNRYVVLIQYTPGDCWEGPTGSGQEFECVTANDGAEAVRFVQGKREPLKPWDSETTYAAYALAQLTKARTVRYDKPEPDALGAVKPPRWSTEA